LLVDVRSATVLRERQRACCSIAGAGLAALDYALFE
jgi:hypothetical protein